MSLKIEDCKEGVEIICIDNSTNINPLKHYHEWIKIGHIYTIKKFSYSKSPKVGVPIIQLNEIRGRTISDGKEYSFYLWRFKKLDPKDIQIFYDILSKPIDQKIREDA